MSVWGLHQCKSWSPCEAQNCWKAGKLRYRSNSSPAAGRAADAFVAETTAPRPCCQTNTSEQLHSSTSQTTLREHTWLLSPRSNAFTVNVNYNTDNEIHSLKRSTDLDKCIDILITRTKLSFLLCFFRWGRMIAVFNTGSSARGGSHIENTKSRRLQPRENTSSSAPARVWTPVSIATCRTVSLLLATSTSSAFIELHPAEDMEKMLTWKNGLYWFRY